jgi:hypothetical protein
MVKRKNNRVGKIMDRKKLISVLLTSAMAIFWACGEGDIVKVTDEDEMIKSKSDPKDTKNSVSDIEFLQPYLDYCNSKEGRKKGCEAELIKVSSSSVEEESASSKSSSSVKKSSSSGKSSSSSSSKGNSSSSKSLPVSGKCDLRKADVVHVGDDVIWRFVADDDALQEADFEWNLGSAKSKIEIADGELSGTGSPELIVSYKSEGNYSGPVLTFAGKKFKCEQTFKVYKEGVDPTSSSSGKSSSSAKSSSSSHESSSSSTPKPYCAVSKHEVKVNENVEWSIVDAKGKDLKGEYLWFDLGRSAEYVKGDSSGTGVAKITVKYTQSGSDKYPEIVYWEGQEVDCRRNELEGTNDPLLVVVADEESSSSSETPFEDSSSSEEVKPKSSSSSKNTNPPCVGECEVID